MDAIIGQAQSLHGTLSVPPDKAICHRAVLLASVADGETAIRPWPSGDDCQRTLHLVQQLGVDVAVFPDAVRLRGLGRDGLRAPSQDLCCGESGTTLRLAAGLLAGQPFESRLTASGSLRQRPMKRVIEPLRKMGAQIQATSMESFEGSPSEEYPPLEIMGTRPLQAIRYEMPVASAQVKSAVLLAGLFANSTTTVIEPMPTRDHTERLLTRLGVSLHRQGAAVTIEPPRQLAAPGRLQIPGDPSSAAFFIVAATLVPDSHLTIHDTGLNPTRIHFLTILKRMGAPVEWTTQDEGWEPRGVITVKSAQLHGTTVKAEEVPLIIDELPILMVAACLAEGESRFEGLGELRVKETDRLHSMVTGLKAMDANLLSSPDGSLVIQGGRSLHGAAVDSFGDHRTAMSLAVAGLAAEGATTVRGAECVAKSFPEFFDCLRRLAGSSTVKTVDKA